jgi:hypothetical protein
MMNKRLIYVAFGICLIAFSCKKEDENPVTDNKAKLDSLVSGALYANDVYYSLKNGVVATQPRNEWDLAFATISQSGSILINSGVGDSLFVWKGGSVSDFNAASSLDISGNLATNFNDSSWFNSSAFEQTIVTSNPYDAGWGVYNMSTHDVVGDSLFILKLSDGSYKKIAIINRSGSTHDYTFKIADLAADAAVDEVTIPVSSYSTKNFVYYSVTSKQIVDREPDKTTWDFVFTKYDRRQPGPLVTGILTNEGVSSVKLAEADSAQSYTKVSFSKAVNNIGSSWKYFNMDTYTYDIVNPFYYVKAKDNSYYRVKFISFASKTGTTVFEKTLLK